MRWDATNRARGAISQPHFVQIVSFVAGFITIILIECIFVVAENEPSLSFFRESFLDFSSHSGRVFSRSQLSSRRGRLSCAPYLSLSLSLAISDFLLILSLSFSLSLYPPFCNLIPRVLCIPISPSFLFLPCLVQPSSRSYKKKAHFVPTLSVQQIWFSLTRIVYLLAKYFASFDHHPCLVVTLSSSLMFFDDTLSSMAFFSSWLFLAARSR